MTRINIVALMIILSCFVYTQFFCEQFKYDPGEILVRVDGVKATERFVKFGKLELDYVLEKYGLMYVEPMELSNWFRLEFAESTDVVPIIKELREKMLVNFITLDFLTENVRDPECSVEMSFGLSDDWPNDPLFPEQWAHQVTKAKDAWLEMKSHKGIKPVVQVLDQGVELTHEDLQGIFYKDKDGSYGHDHTNKFRYNDPSNVNDKEMHATHVWGSIAANINNGKGVAGGTSFLLARNQRVLNESGMGSMESVVNGIKVATDECVSINQGRKNKTGVNGIFNMSLGLSSRIPEFMLRPMKDAIQRAWKNKCVVVAAAGNDGRDRASWPARFPEVLAVAATEQLGDGTERRAWFSNYGEGVNIAAPGHKIWSSVPGDKKYLMASGTSMACPDACGKIAFMVYHYPELTADQVMMIAKTHGDNLGDKTLGLRINMVKMLQKARETLEGKVSVKKFSELVNYEYHCYYNIHILWSKPCPQFVGGETYDCIVNERERFFK